EDLPFFKFINEIDGIKFIVEPTFVKEYNWFFIPHQTSQENFDAAFKAAPKGSICWVHQTVTGAISETGSHLTGFTVPKNRAADTIYAGDIHVPQRVKVSDRQEVVYIGAPTHIHFGDMYQPRILLLDVNDSITERNLCFEAPQKL